MPRRFRKRATCIGGRRFELERHRRCNGVPHEHKKRFPDLQQALCRILCRFRQTESNPHDNRSHSVTHTDRNRAEGDRGNGILIAADYADQTDSESITSPSTSMSKSFRIIAADHTGITVSNLERSLPFWRYVLGFEFSHQTHQTGQLASEITGVPNAKISLAVLKAPGGHRIELLKYDEPTDRKQDGD